MTKTAPTAKTLQSIVNFYRIRIANNDGFTHYLGKPRAGYIVGLTDNDYSKLEPLDLQKQVQKYAQKFGLDSLTIGGRYSSDRDMYCLDVGVVVDIEDEAIALGQEFGQECIVQIDKKGEVVKFVDC